MARMGLRIFMCAVIGYCGPGGTKAAASLARLFHESKIRGLHAFGLAYYADGAIVHERFGNLTHAQANLDAVVRVFHQQPLKLIAHCRYSTSGDWRNMINNQPLHIGSVALAFNGVIHMGTAKEWGAKYGFEPVTDNDGEIFVRKVLDSDDWEKWVREGEFSFAGVMLHDHALVALRNAHRPLYQLRERDATYIGSTSDIFRRAKMGGPDPIEPGVAMVFT